MKPISWAIFGPGGISQDFAAALYHSDHGRLSAVGSSSPARARSFADEHGALVSGSYDDVLQSRNIDAVYIGTVHTTHAELATRALEAGKAVLCEKPMATSAAEARQLLETARQTGMPLVEAYKYRFTPLFMALRKMLEADEIGAVQSLRTSFGFAARTRSGRLFDATLGGGAVLDAGGYPASMAVGVARSSGTDISGPRIINSSARLTHGVEGSTTAQFDLSGMTAQLGASIVSPRSSRVLISGASGTIALPDAWGGRSRSARIIRISRGKKRRTLELPVVHPMAAEADAVWRILSDKHSEASEMPLDESVAVAAILADWRASALRS